MTRCSGRFDRVWPWVVALAALGGCRGAEEFRAVAGDSLQTGLTTITNGVIDGLFAVFEPDATTE